MMTISLGPKIRLNESQSPLFVFPKNAMQPRSTGSVIWKKVPASHVGPETAPQVPVDVSEKFCKAPVGDDQHVCSKRNCSKQEETNDILVFCM